MSKVGPKKREWLNCRALDDRILMKFKGKIEISKLVNVKRVSRDMRPKFTFRVGSRNIEKIILILGIDQ